MSKVSPVRAWPSAGGAYASELEKGSEKVEASPPLRHNSFGDEYIKSESVNFFSSAQILYFLTQLFIL